MGPWYDEICAMHCAWLTLTVRDLGWTSAVNAKMTGRSTSLNNKESWAAKLYVHGCWLVWRMAISQSCVIAMAKRWGLSRRWDGDQEKKNWEYFLGPSMSELSANRIGTCFLRLILFIIIIIIILVYQCAISPTPLLSHCLICWVSGVRFHELLVLTLRLLGYNIRCSCREQHKDPNPRETMSMRVQGRKVDSSDGT